MPDYDTGRLLATAAEVVAHILCQNDEYRVILTQGIDLVYLLEYEEGKGRIHRVGTCYREVLERSVYVCQSRCSVGRLKWRLP